MPTMKIHEQITPYNWCKYATAKDKKGHDVDIFSPKACRWCALGWLDKIYGPTAEGGALELFHKFNKNIKEPIGRWNDSSTFDEVKAAFLKADL